MSSDKYTYRVYYSEEDESFVATCAEFPSISWLEDSPSQALVGLLAAVDEILNDMKESNEPIPEPLTSAKYTGRITLRMPPDLHRRATIRAAEDNISLNRYITDAVAKLG